MIRKYPNIILFPYIKIPIDSMYCTKEGPRPSGKAASPAARLSFQCLILFVFLPSLASSHPLSIPSLPLHCAQKQYLQWHPPFLSKQLSLYPLRVSAPSQLPPALLQFHSVSPHTLRLLSPSLLPPRCPLPNSASSTSPPSHRPRPPPPRPSNLPPLPMTPPTEIKKRRGSRS